MALSVLELFKIGIGPSSSHTVGPMRAACRFVVALDEAGLLQRVTRVRVERHGSLGATGKGQGSDKAELLGLAGPEPDTVDTGAIPAFLERVITEGRITLAGGQAGVKRGWCGHEGQVQGDLARGSRPERHRVLIA